MRRVVVENNKVAAIPEGAYVEVVREASSDKESKPQYAPLAAANVGFTSPTVPTGANQALSGSGALADIDLAGALTTVDTTAAATSNLLVGTVTGQLKTIRMIGDLGDMVITVSGDGIASITLNDTGDVCTVMWTGTGWTVTDNAGCVIA
jgi:hypothetical protein